MPPYRPRILIVDDAPSVRESLRWLLDDEPTFMVVGEAANGAEAITQTLSLKPDLVILDIELPDIDGFAVTRQLKGMGQPPKIVLLSVHDGAIYRQRGAEAGCDAYVEKGIDWLSLLAVLQAVLADEK